MCAFLSMCARIFSVYCCTCMAWMWCEQGENVLCKSNGDILFVCYIIGRVGLVILYSARESVGWLAHSCDRKKNDCHCLSYVCFLFNHFISLAPWYEIFCFTNINFFEFYLILVSFCTVALPFLEKKVMLYKNTLLFLEVILSVIFFHKLFLWSCLWMKRRI